MINDSFKGISNIKLPTIDLEAYGNVDGLSLQTLFFARNRFFPGCFVFDYDSRTNSDYIFDTKAIAREIMNFVSADEDVEITPYYTKVLGGNEELNLGLCIVLNKSNIYARMEKHATDSYILFDNSNVDALNRFLDFVLEHYIKPEDKLNVYWRICCNQGAYYLTEGKIKAPENFDVNALYNDDFANEDEKIKEFINSDDKSGLIILHGEKGTGKSSYIKHLVASYPNKKFVSVPANLVTLLGNPDFGSFLTTLDNHIIILEDCENAIKDRKSSGTSSAVSLLLNMTDGILSDDLNIKFICTFNEDMRNIDPALLRKGRLVSRYEFKPLCAEKAAEILRDRKNIDVMLTKPMTLADIFHYGEEDYEIGKKSII